jgi:lysophospholipase L1-like esterase
MSAPDRSWTVGPTFLWFSVFAIAALRLVDGDWNALADRLTHPREAETPSGGGGPTFQANAGKRAVEEDVATPPAAAPIAPGSRDIGSLDDVCIDGTDAACKKWAMDGFYASLKAARGGTLGRALRVSWYGDSVVASDALPGSLRSRMQSELGDGGPGFVYAVPPHRFCGHGSISRSGGDNWLAYAISTVHTGDGFYGPGGASFESNSGSTSMKLAGAAVTNAELYYLAQPSGGTAVVKADGKELVRQGTAANAKTAAWVTSNVPGGSKRFEIKAEGKTRVFGVSLENSTGAVVDNFGIVNVNAKTFATHNQAAYETQLAHRSADLVIIMIGANEAQWLKVGEKSMKDYQAQYEKVLGPVRRARPDATCLVMSPTDEAEPKDSGYQSRPIIGAIAEAQRKAAHAQGCAYYSSYQWMGGSGSAVKWFKRRLISSDMIHLTTAGAQKVSGGLFDALMAGSKNAGN